METKTTIIFTCIILVAIAISFTIMQIFLRKMKLKSETDGQIHLSYAILFITWILAFTILNLKIFIMLNESFDFYKKINPDEILGNAFKLSVTYIGIANLWLIIWYFIAESFATLFIGKRKDIFEIENDNYSYFLMKGVIFISFILCLMPVFDMILKVFFPDLDIPFYR